MIETERESIGSSPRNRLMLDRNERRISTKKISETLLNEFKGIQLKSLALPSEEDLDEEDSVQVQTDLRSPVRAVSSGTVSEQSRV
jgi:hypothetical protein